MCCGEPPAVYVEKTVRARTAKRCCECGAPILPGDSYRRCNGVWDGRGATYNRCGSCWEVNEEIEAQLHIDDCRPCFAALVEEVHNTAEEDRSALQLAMLERIAHWRKERGAGKHG